MAGPPPTPLDPPTTLVKGVAPRHYIIHPPSKEAYMLWLLKSLLWKVMVKNKNKIV